MLVVLALSTAALLQPPAALSSFRETSGFNTISPFAAADRLTPGMSATRAGGRAIGAETAKSSADQTTSQPSTRQAAERRNKHDDKYILNTCLHETVSSMLKSHTAHFESITANAMLSEGVKGGLKSHIDFWSNEIKACQFVIDTISQGYVIPFMIDPPSMHNRNNKSARINDVFVTETITELMKAGCIVKVPFRPYVVSPLSVATNSGNKKRLILDLSVLNRYVRKEKVKFEDWKVAAQYFSHNSYMFKFDLKSGYFHIDVCPQHMSYLGFCWESEFYCFTVLPFGLSSAPYIFTKCLRPMVDYWRKHAIKIVLYLDDGLGICESHECCKNEAGFVVKSLQNAGFTINEQKSCLLPTQYLEWLGIIWDATKFCIHIPDRRMRECLENLEHLKTVMPHVSARQVARCTGRLISMSPVYGNVCRLMTRNCYRLIENRHDWDSCLFIENPEIILSELNFWLENLTSLNVRQMNDYSKSEILICSDASDIAAGAVCVSHNEKYFHQMFSEQERLMSSTWRELKALQQSIFTFGKDIKGKTVKVLTDNQNCVKIVEAGSTKGHLQTLALFFFFFVSKIIFQLIYNGSQGMKIRKPIILANLEILMIGKLQWNFLNS